MEKRKNESLSRRRIVWTSSSNEGTTTMVGSLSAGRHGRRSSAGRGRTVCESAPKGEEEKGLERTEAAAAEDKDVVELGVVRSQAPPRSRGQAVAPEEQTQEVDEVGEADPSRLQGKVGARLGEQVTQTSTGRAGRGRTSSLP